MGGFIISSEGKEVSVGLSKEGSCSLTLKDILKSLPQLSTLSSKHTEELPRFGATSQKLEQGRMKSEGAQKRRGAGERHALVNPTLSEEFRLKNFKSKQVTHKIVQSVCKFQPMSHPRTLVAKGGRVT